MTTLLQRSNLPHLLGLSSPPISFTDLSSETFSSFLSSLSPSSLKRQALQCLLLYSKNILKVILPPLLSCLTPPSEYSRAKIPEDKVLELALQGARAALWWRSGAVGL
jgi:hypothetical protein